MVHNLQPTSTSDTTIPLTPSALSEVEAALTYNETLQTSSAGRPQPTTPQRLPSNNYICAALNMGANPGAPYPPSLQAQGSIDSTESVGHEDDVVARPLSRGTTQAVLEKMASPEFGSALRKRMSREGEGRASSVPIRPTESERDVTVTDRGGDEKGVRTVFNTEQSRSHEAVKKMMEERLMWLMDNEDRGYSSAGGGT